MPERRHPEDFIRDITVVDDGVRPLREAHRWTRDKLGILTSYYGAYARACRSAGDFYLADPMAGAGLCHIAETDEYLLGSPLIAARTQPSFARSLAMELEPRAFQALTSRAAPYADRLTIVRGDVNEDFEPALVANIPRTRPLFVLFDPEGAELHWETVRMTAGYREGRRKTELLVLFSTEGVNRMLPVEREIELHNEMALNVLFPPEARWRETWLMRRADELSPAEARLRYVEGYQRGLEALGYRAVFARDITRPGGGTVYHLLFATDHDAGDARVRVDAA